ncbi:hypothetical protein scyTo_0006450 [Scyliorhinus torazame]|uniref:Uncharacterized protein n=1 Tax=Scyliorhinus torazame TaxID=75743 RepID=A0A401PI24_SCYTO|nr:hypothetical protein [Scyliorhinus torazame]
MASQSQQSVRDAGDVYYVPVSTERVGDVGDVLHWTLRLGGGDQVDGWRKEAAYRRILFSQNRICRWIV